MDDFGSDEPSNEEAGLAETGYVFDLSLGYLFSEYFGLIAMIRGQNWDMNSSTFVEELSKIDPTITWEVSTGIWRTGGLYLGPYASFEVSNNTYFDVRGMFGFVSASTPEIGIVTTNTYGQKAYIDQTSDSEMSIAFLIGAGIRYELNDQFVVLGNFDYTALQPEFTVTATSPGFQPQSNTWTQPMNNLNVVVGFGLRLN